MKRGNRTARAFTLIEVILALGILALLTGAIYGITSASLDATRTTLDEQFAVRRVASFLRVTRDAFLNLPREGTVHLRFTRASGGAPVPELVFEEAAGLFGIPSLGGGSLILAARPRADGSRTFALLRVPKGIQGTDLERLSSGNNWLPLLPRVEKVKWTFLSDGEWKEEWPEGSGRPLAVRLQMDYLELPGVPVDSQFWIPELGQAAQPPPAPVPPPETTR